MLDPKEKLLDALDVDTVELHPVREATACVKLPVGKAPVGTFVHRVWRSLSPAPSLGASEFSRLFAPHVPAAKIDRVFRNLAGPSRRLKEADCLAFCLRMHPPDFAALLQAGSRLSPRPDTAYVKVGRDTPAGSPPDGPLSTSLGLGTCTLL
jgi:hypothetical protein